MGFTKHNISACQCLGFDALICQREDDGQKNSATIVSGNNPRLALEVPKLGAVFLGLADVPEMSYCALKLVVCTGSKGSYTLTP